MFDSAVILKGEIWRQTIAGIRGIRKQVIKKIMTWFKQVFDYVSNIWCFHM